MGEIEGNNVGARVENVGSLVGQVGLAVTNFVGRHDGTTVGYRDGDAVGVSVGYRVGCNVG